jgi:hypothetical protein
MIPDTVPSMMRRVDADGDGSMSFEEFKGLLQVRLRLLCCCPRQHAVNGSCLSVCAVQAQLHLAGCGPPGSVCCAYCMGRIL